MTYIHLEHAAGTAKLLCRLGVNTTQARANEKGAQIVIDAPVPESLLGEVEDENEHGKFLFGTWIMEPAND